MGPGGSFSRGSKREWHETPSSHPGRPAGDFRLVAQLSVHSSGFNSILHRLALRPADSFGRIVLPAPHDSPATVVALLKDQGNRTP